MAKIDFCFTFYDGDAARDMSHMNRQERGAYLDILLSQRKFGRLSLDQIKKVLGKDFTADFPAIELILKLVDGLYFVEWLDNSIIASKTHSKMQSKRRNSTGSPPDGDRTPTECPPNANANSTHAPVYSHLKEDEDENEDVKGVRGVGKEGGQESAGIPRKATAQEKAFTKAFFDGTLTDEEDKAGPHNYKPEIYSKQ